MTLAISKSEGDYLKAIYKLTLDQELTSTVALADMMQVKPLSVTSMLIKLANQEPPLVEYRKRRGVSLSEEGRKKTLRLLRRHRLLELFLAEILLYKWEDVHPEADELEHVISSQFEDRLAALLGEPKFDPHGDPIPDKELNLPVMDTIPLTELAENTPSYLRRFHVSDPETLNYLSKQGFFPGAKIIVQSRSPIDNTVQLLIGDEKTAFALGEQMSKQLFVDRVG